MFKSELADASYASPPSVLARLKQAFLLMLTRPSRALPLIFLVTILTHLPSGFGSFVADDYMQWAMLKGSPILQDLGFEKAQSDKPISHGLLEGFHFFSSRQDSSTGYSTLEHYRSYGNLLWWSGENISMVPLRPLAALTHWIDYTLFNDQLWLHQLHSLLYFLLLAGLTYALYFKFANHPEQGAVISPNAMLLVASLATLLAIVDFSLTRSFFWVVARNSYLACAIGIGALLCFVRWREQHGYQWLILTMGLFAAALLTAEAALAAAGYMGAYVLCLERKPLWRKAVVMLPVITVIVLWRIGYSEGGFGSLNIAQYIDPVRSPAQFGANFLLVFPMIVLNQVSGLDSLVIFLHPEHQWMLISFAWWVTFAGLFLIRRFLLTSAVDRFWFVGSVVAAIPGTALISAESRTMTFVAIGFFALLAKWLTALYQARAHWAPRWVFRGVVSWHFVFPLLLSALLTSGLLGYSQLSRQYESIAGSIESGKTGLVIVNPDSSGMMYYLPFEWAFRQFALPGTMSVLTTGLETSDITRVSEREFLLSVPAGMPLTHSAPLRSLRGDQPIFSGLYAALYTQSFFTTPTQRLRSGEVLHYSDIRITILKTNDVGPTLVRLEFIGEERPDDKVWQFYDWKTLKYQKIEPIAIHETRRFTGPLDKN